MRRATNSGLQLPLEKRLRSLSEYPKSQIGVLHLQKLTRKHWPLMQCRRFFILQMPAVGAHPRLVADVLST